MIFQLQDSVTYELAYDIELSDVVATAERDALLCYDVADSEFRDALDPGFLNSAFSRIGRLSSLY